MAVGLSTDKRFQRTSGGLTVDGGMVVEEREQMKLNLYSMSGRLEEHRTEKDTFCKAELGTLSNS